MRRFALYSDIHGNSVALDAVLADIESAGLAERYCLGDLVGYGPDSPGVIARVRATGDPVIRGNYDDGVGLPQGPVRLLLRHARGEVRRRGQLHLHRRGPLGR